MKATARAVEAAAKIEVVNDERNIQNLIRTVRGVQVMLDRDIARLYGVETGALNRQVKRNAERFPEDFMFRLSVEEWGNLKCQNGISSWGGDRQLPYAFTENGIAMLSSVRASLKDLGHRCFGFTKMDAAQIRRIKAAAFSPAKP